ELAEGLRSLEEGRTLRRQLVVPAEMGERVDAPPPDVEERIGGGDLRRGAQEVVPPLRLLVGAKQPARQGRVAVARDELLEDREQLIVPAEALEERSPEAEPRDAIGTDPRLRREQLDQARRGLGSGLRVARDLLDERKRDGLPGPAQELQEA